MKTKWYLLLAAALSMLMPCAVQASSCTAGRFHFINDNGCDPRNGGAGGVPPAKCPDCPGMPVWWVSEPYEDIWIKDTPLSYRTSSGQAMDFTFFYRQNFRVPNLTGGADYYVYGTSAPRFSDDYGFLARNGSLTNAAWGNNWKMDIVLWDQNWENSYQAPPHINPPVFQDGYQACVVRPEGGIYYFYTNSTNSSLSYTKDPSTQVWLQPLSAAGFPVVLLQAADTNGICWGGSDPQTNGFCLHYPDGSTDIFGLTYFTESVAAGGPQPSGANSTARALLTERVDPQGRVTRVGYESSDGGFRVKYVVDADGRTNTFLYYTNNGNFFNPPTPNSWMLTEIDDPYGRKTQLGYAMVVVGSSNWGALTSITDAAGMTSYFQYDAPVVTNQILDTTCNCLTNIAGLGISSGWITNLSTPYGNTSFSYYDVPNADPDTYQQRAIYVSEPEGAQQLYYYVHYASSLMATTATKPTVPGHTDFDDGNSGTNHPTLNYRNTVHWGRRQFTALSSGVQSYLASGAFSNALFNLTAADFKKGRTRNWLWQPDAVSISDALASEQDPSPDAAGSVTGLRTWYDYAGKPSPEVTGSNPQVNCIARVLPDGSSQYTTYNYYAAGSPGAGLASDNESTYSLPDGTVGLLTNWFGYATNNIDLTSISNSAGQFVNYGYTNHSVADVTNALNQVTTLSWETTVTHNLQSVQLPSGETISLTYYPPVYSGHFLFTNATTSLLKQISFQPEGRVFNIVPTNGLPGVVTDDRGLTVANTWDGLNRLTGIVFPDNTSISNVYYRLDLVASKDRLGLWTYYGFDGLQHLTTVTNANNAVTSYSWCGCGSLTAILDALTNQTTLSYDNQGNLTNVAFPDYSSVAYQFDLARRMTNASDGAGRYLQLAYNIQGLVKTVTGANGTLQSAVYDAVNRPINITDADGITVTNTFDAINELLKRTWPDGISENYGYSTNGLVAYTNRDQKVTRYVRDGARRVTEVTNANTEVTQLGYDSLDDVTNLIDGLLHQTTWQYNEYGWLTNKTDGLTRNVFRYAYNPSGWVTNRWTPEKGNTGYTFDNVGNLKSIIYPQQTITYAYNLLNELTNMVDAVGTHGFSWTATGQLQSEDGPWTNDTVTDTYAQGLRTALTLSQPSGSWSQTNGFDFGWRLQTLTSPVGSFGYNFQSASKLVTSISLPNGATITNRYDALARLNETDLNNYWGHTLDGYAYAMDPLGLRTNIVRNLGLTSSGVNAGYDNIAQLTSWSASETGGTLRQNEQLGFGYDEAHNLHTRNNGSLTQTFTTDAANELTSVARTGTFTMSGATPAPTTSVTVNGNAAQTYGDFTFAATNLTLLNGNNTFTNIAQNTYGVTTTNTFTVNLPASVTLTNDSNGSLTNDGTRTFGYDSENQLTNVMVPGSWKTEFVYDGLNRRRIIRDYSWSSGWVKTNETRLIYDGYLPIQERDSNNAPLVTYTRGLDMSGTLQGAGGIGGLLARTDASGSTFYHADGGGNITALMDSQENMVARYLYNPFGKLLGQWGSMANANVIQFSSMAERRGIILYPLRGYDPSFQRWLNQDKIQENGGINLYRFVGNNPVNLIDPFGLAPTVDLMQPKSPDDEYARKYPTDNSVFSVFGHGNSDYVFNNINGEMQPIDPATLTDMIKKDPNYKPNEPVKLISCNAGTGNNSIAQKLANNLGVNVYAPANFAALTQDGDIYVGAQANPKINPSGIIDFTKHPSEGLTIFRPSKQ